MPDSSEQGGWRKHARRAAHAHSNLNIFHAVGSILESSHIYGSGSESARKTATQIIKLCEREQARQLDAYDSAIGALPASPEEPRKK